MPQLMSQLITELSTQEGLILMVVFTLQGLLLTYDEVFLHRRREMPKWERIGHPVDTFFFLLPFALAGFFGSLINAPIFIGLSILSSVVIMKDEWVHVGRINVRESLVHSALFILHPVTLYWGYKNYLLNHIALMQNVALTLLGVCLIQIIYWNYLDYKLIFNKNRG